MAECPSQSYLSLVVTSGGLTPKEPYGFTSSNWDYAEWHVVVEDMIARMERSREYLGSIEQAPYSQWERLRQQANDVRARISALPQPWDFTDLFDVKVEVPRAVDIAITATCLWEQHDQAAEDLGGTPPARPSEVAGGKGGGTLSKIPWWGWTIAGVATVSIFLGTLLIGTRELRLRGMSKLRGKNPGQRRRRRKVNMGLKGS